MRGVDLARWRFDWDLTFAMVAAHPDGTVLHRYGGRDARSADHWLNQASLLSFLRAGLASHAAHKTKNATLEQPVALEDIPAFALRDKGACIHCHSVNPAMRLEAQAAGTWSRDDLWTYPAPSRIGLDLDQEHQTQVLTVDPLSPAATAGIQVGDRLVRLGKTNVATASDVMAALHEVPNRAAAVDVLMERGGAGEQIHVQLKLGKDWKAASPEDFAWRPSKWGLSPAPGFGGPVLNAGQLRELGLAPGTFAFRINYLVTWGENKRWGQRAAEAGIRDGQVVLGAGDKRDFLSIDHFHAWWRLTHKSGEVVDVWLWEAGQERKLTLPIGG